MTAATGRTADGRSACGATGERLRASDGDGDGVRSPEASHGAICGPTPADNTKGDATPDLTRTGLRDATPDPTPAPAANGSNSRPRPGITSRAVGTTRSPAGAGETAALVPAGQELRTVVELVAPALRGSAAFLWRPQGLRERYLRYLATMHAVVRASVPLMELALARCGGHAGCEDGAGGEPADPVLGALARYLPGHIARERDHDAWLVRDMAAAGLDPDRELAGPPPPDVARLVGAQYYWIAHFHPLCLLGYVAVLELHAPERSLAPFLAARTGLPAAAFETVRLHADEDDGHSAAVLAALDAIAPPPGLRHAVRLSALHTVRALTDVLDGLSAPDVPPRRGAGPALPDREGNPR